jgi:hypothetical protein
MQSQKNNLLYTLNKTREFSIENFSFDFQGLLRFNYLCSSENELMSLASKDYVLGEMVKACSLHPLGFYSSSLEKERDPLSNFIRVNYSLKFLFFESVK